MIRQADWQTTARIRKMGHDNDRHAQHGVLHFRFDDVISFGNSEEFIRISGLFTSALIEHCNDHRLAEEEPLEAMLGACERFANSSRDYT